MIISKKVKNSNTLKEKTKQNTPLHPSVLLIQFRVMLGLEAIPAMMGREA